MIYPVKSKYKVGLKLIVISLFVLFSTPSFAGHHEVEKNKEIIFILDMLVIEGKEDGVDDLIERLVSNVNSTEPGTIVYEYFKSSNGQVSLYEVYKDDRAAQFHAISFLNGNLRKEFEETFEVKNFQVLGNSSNKLKEIMTVYTRDHRKITNGFRR